MVKDIGSVTQRPWNSHFDNGVACLKGGNMDRKQGALQGIGRKLREEARQIVEGQLPARLAELLYQLEQAATRSREARTRP
jgi:hypothetical protein